MVLITDENDEKYRELRRNEETTVGELKVLIDKMGLTGTVKKNVGGALQRKKSDIRAEILKWYPDPDRPPLGEVSANPRAPPPPPPPEFASPVATRRAAVPLRTPQQKLDDALETRDKAAAVASLQVLSPSGFKGMKFKLNEVKQKFPEETKGVKGLGAKGYTLADFGESLIKALEKAMRPSAPPGRGDASVEAPVPEAAPAAAPMEVELRAATEPAAPEAPRLAAMEVDAAAADGGAGAPPPSPEPDFFEAVSNLFGWLAPAAAETEDAAAPPVPAPAATNWLGIPNSGVARRLASIPPAIAGEATTFAERFALARYALGSDCSPDDNEHRWRDMGARGVANVRRAARLTSAGGDLALELEADDHVDAGDEKKAKFRFLPEAVREADGRRAHRDFGLAACQYRLLFSYHDRPLLVFFAEAGPGLRDVSVEAVRDAIVPPEVRRALGRRKAAKRLRLAFSKTLRGVDLAPDQVAYPREPIRAGDGEDAVDGLALVSRTALRESGLWSFDAVQIRRGAKAMALAVDDAYLRENFGDGCHLALYPSAVKFRFAEAASAPLEFKLRGWKGDGDEDTSASRCRERPRSTPSRTRRRPRAGHCVVGVDDDEVKIEGPVAIMTDPTLAPEDVLVLDAVPPPRRCSKRRSGVLMLPTTARHPTAEFLCGGDYDGDTAVVLWRREIVDGLGAAPGAGAARAAAPRSPGSAASGPTGPGRRRRRGGGHRRRRPRAGRRARSSEPPPVQAGRQARHAVPGDGSLSLANFALKDFPYDATPWTPGGYDRAVGPADYAGAQASLRAKLNDVLGDLEAFDFGREPAFDPSLLDLAHGDGGDAAVRATGRGGARRA
ncbi:hypothetical protein JL720_15458 [Aureococcus anophagefferens]|nr:hypothetical protein JL720_15458 [Aureococcus anophagefferens]